MKISKKPKGKELEEEEKEEEEGLSSDESDEEHSSKQIEESSLQSAGRKGPSRNSKDSASAKIALQLSEINEKSQPTRKKSSRDTSVTDMLSELKI